MTPGSDLSLHYYRTSHIPNTSTGAPLYQPKTLLLGDSFTDTSKQYIAPYFADLTMMHNQSSGLEMANAMIGRSTVIFQVAERMATTGYSVLLTDSALHTIATVLAAHPVARSKPRHRRLARWLTGCPTPVPESTSRPVTAPSN